MRRGLGEPPANVKTTPRQGSDHHLRLHRFAHFQKTHCNPLLVAPIGVIITFQIANVQYVCVGCFCSVSISHKMSISGEIKASISRCVTKVCGSGNQSGQIEFPRCIFKTIIYGRCKNGRAGNYQNGKSSVSLQVVNLTKISQWSI